MCDDCEEADAKAEYIASLGLIEAETAGALVNAGWSVDDAKGYARQARPVEDHGPVDEEWISYWENRTP